MLSFTKSFGCTPPSWKQTGSYVNQVLRFNRFCRFDDIQQAAEDDVIPFTTPVTTSTGEAVSSITIAQGTIVSSPIRAMNRSEVFWGPNAKEFEPERWIEESDTRSKEISGHRHLLTFSDGPRICLGRNFALTEFKVCRPCLCYFGLSLTTVETRRRYCPFLFAIIPSNCQMALLRKLTSTVGFCPDPRSQGRLGPRYQ
jgi:hypothetical protein